MSTLAGMLLMYMNEEEAFWSLSILLTDRKYAMHGLFIEGFPKLTRFLAHHDKILTKFIPKLKKHFDSYSLDSILYCLKWFFVIFVERVSRNFRDYWKFQLKFVSFLIHRFHLVCVCVYGMCI